MARLFAHRLVRMERLELSRLTALPPQDSVSTNSTTSASIVIRKRRCPDLFCLCQPDYLPDGAVGAGCCCAGGVAGEFVAGAFGLAGAVPPVGGKPSPGSWDGAGAGASCWTVSTTLVGCFYFYEK